VQKSVVVVEKTGVEELMGGVQEMGIRGGKVENLEKRRGSKKMEKESKAPPSENPRGTQNHSARLAYAIRPTASTLITI
jgi:hypothetical protein